MNITKRKICVFTASRAEYGLLKPLISKIKNDESLDLQLLVSGSHLSPEFGLTYKEIEADQFDIDEIVEMVMSSDTPSSICKSFSLGLMGYGDALNRLKPSLLIVLGDRYETLAISIAAQILRVPIAHVQGGELSEGAIDDAMRHSITKMSHLHFVSTDQYRRRVIQLGENPNHVFNVGSLNSEVIEGFRLMKKNELEKNLNFVIVPPTCLITLHPETIHYEKSRAMTENMLEALRSFPDLRCIFTKSNIDTNGRIINNLIEEFVKENRARSVCFTSMGQLRYLSCMKYVDFIIGNSSSGIIESPSFRKPTINIGARQQGRMRAANVIDCGFDISEIRQAVNLATSNAFIEEIKMMSNPYYLSNTSSNIIKEIKIWLDKESNGKKFFDL